LLKAGRVVFNINGNDYRLICKVDFSEQIVEIRWFGSHTEYDAIDAETI
jgi:mRNA interferase HigB